MLIRLPNRALGATEAGGKGGFDVEAVIRKYPVKYDQSMNTILPQELLRTRFILQLFVNVTCERLITCNLFSFRWRLCVLCYCRFSGYNKLVTVVGTSVSNIQKAVKGLVVMTPELEAVANSFLDNKVRSMHFAAFNFKF